MHDYTHEQQHACGKHCIQMLAWCHPTMHS